MSIISKFGYQMNWLAMGILGLIGVGFGYWVIKLVKNENENKSKLNLINANS